MRFHFILDGLSAQHQDDLLAVEKAMTPRAAHAVFEIKARRLRSDHDLEGAWKFVRSILSPFHLEPFEALLAATGLDLQQLAKLVKNVPVAMKPRPVSSEPATPSNAQ